jgi:hypothetical protein
MGTKSPRSGLFLEEIAAVPSSATNADALVPHLKKCGYSDAQLVRPFKVGEATIDVAAFAGRPFDNWSACLAAVNLDGESKASAAKAWNLGAASVFVCGPLGVDWYGLGAKGPTIPKQFQWADVPGFFREHKAELAPRAIYDAKLRRPTAKTVQMTFFDAGLMPWVEKTRGESLLQLVESAISGLTKELGSLLTKRQAQEDVYRTVFWQLAAKVLHDKGVPNFVKIDLANVDQVFDRIGKHHGVTDRFPPFGKEGRRAIDAMASSIAACGSLRDVSSESIAYVYENALLDKAAGAGKAKTAGRPYDIRKELGIHSTPSLLIQHMFSQIWRMVEEIEPEDRVVFEPACGHAPFLTGAMRWLRSWNDKGESETDHDYMRKHMRGVEADPFAIELAKLALTLADEPHGNSWAIQPGDMFAPGVLEREMTKHAKERPRVRILLSNPPYEAFTDAQRRHYAKLGEPITANTKAVEMLKRTLPHLPPGGVFGVVMPVGVLHDKESKPVREELLRDFDLSEISVFADNLFEHGDHEVAVLMGRKKKPRSPAVSLMYRRVREAGMAAFKERLAFSWEREVSQSRFANTPEQNMWLPDLVELWDYLASSPRLGQVAHVQQGRQYWQEDKLADLKLLSSRHREGFVEAALRADIPYSIYDVLQGMWIDPGRASFRTQGGGAAPNVPQVLVGYSPVSRVQWRLKAVIDDIGLAASSRWVTFRPSTDGPSRLVLWAVLNSPMANAYAFCYSGKRETLVGEWNEFPFVVHSEDQQQLIQTAAARYRAMAIAKAKAKPAPSDLFNPSTPPAGPVPTDAEVRAALLAMDAAVLRAYDLPPRLERQLLDLFAGVERKGVGLDGADGKSTFRGYYPPGFTAYIPLHELISESFADSTAGRLARECVPIRSKAADEALALADSLARGG